MRCLKRAAVLAILILTLASVVAPLSIEAASVKSTGTVEIFLNQEEAIIQGENYEYTIELTNLDGCDKELSTDFTCIPTIAVNIKQLDNETKEIVDSETLEHMNFGVHDLNILYDDVTIVSLNVVYIALLDNKAMIEIAYKSKTTETNILEISARDNINTSKSQSYSFSVTVSNNGDALMDTFLIIDDMASAQRVMVDGVELRRGEDMNLKLQPGERTLDITFVPLIEGHHTLSITIDNVKKEIPVLVHTSFSTSTNILYIDKAPLNEILKDDQIVFDIKMDSAYLFGFSFIILVFGGVLGFIKGGGGSPPPKIDDGR